MTLVDYATRWPEAVALKSTTTENISEQLMTIFSRLGIPDEILSDNGSNFSSHLMSETMKLMGIKHSFTTPYNPQANGLCERFNGTLKSMLRKVTAERPEDWDRYIPAVLFAYREIPQETTGFSPFELMYGRQPRGPIKVIADIFKGRNHPHDEIIYAYDHVNELRTRIDDSCKLAREATEMKAEKYKTHADAKRKIRKFIK